MDDLFLSPRFELNNEKIETSSTASTLLKKQEGSYFDLTGSYIIYMIKEIKNFNLQMYFINLNFSQNLFSYNESQTILKWI